MITIGQNKELFCEVCKSRDCIHVQNAVEVLDIRENSNNIASKVLKYSERSEKFEENLLRVVEGSDKINKELYIISKLKDGTYACSCPSFWLLRGGKTATTQNAKGETVKIRECKHIERYKDNNNVGYEEDEIKKSENATVFQRMLMLALLPSNAKEEEIQRIKEVTREQAYFIIQELLSRNGLTFPQVVSYLNKSKPIPKFPLLTVGVEFEGGGIRRQKLENIIKELGYYGVITDTYDSMEAAKDLSVMQEISSSENYRSRHTRVTVVKPDMSKINRRSSICYINTGTDSSISLPDTFELKTGKCLGLNGINSVKGAVAFLENFTKKGVRVNRSCGIHISIGYPKADNFGVITQEEKRKVFELSKIYHGIMRPLLEKLVDESRLGNEYCKFLDVYNTPEMAFYVNRRLAINIRSFFNTETGTKKIPKIEFRLLNAISKDLESKLTAWIVLHMKLCEKVLLEESMTFTGLEQQIKKIEERASEEYRENRENRENRNRKVEMLKACFLIDKIFEDCDTPFYRDVKDRIVRRYSYFTATRARNEVDSNEVYQEMREMLKEKKYEKYLVEDLSQQQARPTMARAVGMKN